MTAIEIRGVEKRFGSRAKAVHALRGVTLDIAEGEIYGLLGRNGAGKTTLVKILLDIVRASAGSASIMGQSTRKVAAREHSHVSFASWLDLGLLPDSPKKPGEHDKGGDEFAQDRQDEGPACMERKCVVALKNGNEDATSEIRIAKRNQPNRRVCIGCLANLATTNGKGEREVHGVARACDSPDSRLREPSALQCQRQETEKDGRETRL